MKVNDTIAEVTRRIIDRSKASRNQYLERIENAARYAPHRQALGCANQAHGFAACCQHDKAMPRSSDVAKLAIVSAYNDMLSAHQPYERFPKLIREAAHDVGAVAQVAGGVPAMCDGITQGEPGMELFLFSREVIALSTAVALSHNTFDAVAYLGICDKIVPGLLIGALSFGHLPGIFLPGGPMRSGYSNENRKMVRQRFAEGQVTRDQLLQVEAESYHSSGTCTFYGTANTNQMMMEIMGLHLPGSSFVNANTPLCQALTREGVKRVLSLTSLGRNYRPIGKILDERVFVNGVVGLLASGGSTNHSLHMIPMAAAAGIKLCWSDFEELAKVTPLLVRIYPNGEADVNHFHASGGMSFLIHELLGARLLHADVQTIAGEGLHRYTREPFLLEDGSILWREGRTQTGDRNILRTVNDPFDREGGLTVLNGNLGKAIVKTSALSPDRRKIRASVRIFHTQEPMLKAFHEGELHRDVVVVIRFQGPKANGMPELHKLLPSLQAIQNHGFNVALVTDGRLSGASGDVLSAIHVTPEAADGGPIARLRNGDLVAIDAENNALEALLDPDEWASRTISARDDGSSCHGVGRELFTMSQARLPS